MSRWAVVLAMLIAAPVIAQTFSPGELAEPHRKLEGIGNCTKCHAEGKQLAASLCLDCHTDVKRRVGARSGLHGKLSTTDREQCQNCHKEHQGVAAKLIDWGRGVNQFDHNRTGYPLRGKHAQQKCQACHDNRRIVDPAVQATLAKEPRKQTWLGIGKTCTSCHFDEHRGQEKQDCERCHVETAWKPAPRFDHKQTGFPLRGKHAGVACKECHAQTKDSEAHPPFPAPLSSSYLHLSPIAHSKCLTCHDDPHRGKFSKNCESCHSVEGWTTIKKSSEREFHDKTNFPLKGAHHDVVCTACHGPWPGRPAKFRGLAFKQCSDCHTDAHGGQLKAACDTCHDVEHFTPARFELEDHQKSKFPLEGAHSAVPCTSCHLPTGSSPAVKTAPPLKLAKPARGKARDKRGKAAAHPASAVVVATSAWRFSRSGELQRCETCHRDPHAAQLTHFSDGCRHCHDSTSFSVTRFDHKETSFPLTGKHAAAICSACHKEATIGGRKATRYQPLDSSCGSCHRDEHVGQFRGKGCETCHGTEGWKPSLFSHDNPQLTSFRLDGKHQKAACASCHKPIVAGGVKATRYRPLPQRCEACHEDFHKGDFRGFVR